MLTDNHMLPSVQRLNTVILRTRAEEKKKKSQLLPQLLHRVSVGQILPVPLTTASFKPVNSYTSDCHTTPSPKAVPKLVHTYKQIPQGIQSYW